MDKNGRVSADVQNGKDRSRGSGEDRLPVREVSDANREDWALRRHRGAETAEVRLAERPIPTKGLSSDEPRAVTVALTRCCIRGNSAADLERTALAFARFADLQSSRFSGHSEAVADIACRAGQVLGLGTDTIGRLRLAGLLHDIGSVAVPTSIWDSRRAVSTPERRLVELDSWETQPVLAAADVACALAQDRPHHPAFSKASVASTLAEEARQFEQWPR